MPTIAELGRKVDTRSVIIRGKAFEVRRLSVAQTDAVRRSVPLPVPPVGYDRTKGSSAPAVLDYEDPRYRRDVASRERRVSLVEACVALGLELEVNAQPLPVPGVVESEAKWAAYAEAAWNAVAVGGLLYDDEINAIHEALADVTPDTMLATAEGN
ncbi:MAG: hypothetical protein U0638_01685 [Phycisphaerales bacterium]